MLVNASESLSEIGSLCGIACDTNFPLQRLCEIKRRNSWRLNGQAETKASLLSYQFNCGDLQIGLCWLSVLYRHSLRADGSNQSISAKFLLLPTCHSLYTMVVFRVRLGYSINLDDLRGWISMFTEIMYPQPRGLRVCKIRNPEIGRRNVQKRSWLVIYRVHRLLSVQLWISTGAL